MFNLLRTHQRPLLIAFTIVAIVAFVFLYNPADLDRMRDNVVGSIYGRDVKIIEVQQYDRKIGIAAQLGLYSTLEALSYKMTPNDKDSRAYAFTWNSIVVNHEAERLGITPTPAELAKFVQSSPRFQTNGTYDPMKYAAFVTEIVTPNGFTEEQVFEIIRTDLRLQRLRELVETPIAVSDAEVRSDYVRFRQKLRFQAVSIPSIDPNDSIVPTEEERKAAYDARIAEFKVPSSRELAMVEFVLTDEQKQLTGAPKAQAFQALLIKAKEFAQKMLEPEAKFDVVAQSFGLQPKDLGAVSESTIATQLPNVDGAKAALSRPSEADPNSDVLQGPDGLLLLHLKKFTPERTKSLEEVSDIVNETIISEKRTAKAKERAKSVRDQVAEGMKNGQTFGEAVAKLELTLIDLPPSSMDAPDATVPLSGAFRPLLAKVAPGDITEVVPTPDGFAIGFVAERMPIDGGRFNEERGQLEEMLKYQRKGALFFDWLDQARTAAKLTSRFI